MQALSRLLGGEQVTHGVARNGRVWSRSEEMIVADSFDVIETDERKREAQLFTAGLLTGANIGAVILHGLVIKGVFTKEMARALLDDAQSKTVATPVPKGYENAVRHLFETIKAGF
jgi:hypothetical protein